MAIQHRRGNYADLDPSKLVQGEPFITLDNAPDGHPYVGIAQGPNNVIRLASYDELTDIKQDCEDARDDAEQARDDAQTAETNAENSALDSEAWAVGQKNGTDVPSTDPRYENNSKYYSEQSGIYWGYIDNAVDLVVPTVGINWATGELEYSGSQLLFYIDQATGNMMWNVVAH